MLTIILFSLLTLTFTGCNDGLIGSEAPKFTLPDTQGKQVSSSLPDATPTLLNFWQMNCPECIEEMPYIQALHQNSEKNIRILAVNLGDSTASVSSFMNDNGYSFQVLFDNFGVVAGHYGIRFTPTSYLVDTNGRIADVRIGPFADMDDLYQFIE
jgi:peroxiredoxin